MWRCTEIDDPIRPSWRRRLPGIAVRACSSLLVAVMAAAAHAEMWKCVDQDGNIRYTNVKSDARGCKALSLEPVTTVPAVRLPQKPANFPSVGAETQKQRDADRRKILEQELAQEQQLLDEAKKQLAEQEATRGGNEKNYARVQERIEPYQRAVKLHEANIESLRKEIANSR
jgi:septal ring factor EnvC (AmiA/AmiB activator)